MKPVDRQSGRGDLRAIFALFPAMIAMLAVAGPAMAYDTLWVTGGSLAPGTRGFYPNGPTRNGTYPLGSVQGYKVHVLTWVADVPATATYSVWERQGDGLISVRVDDTPVPYGGYRQVGGNDQYHWIWMGDITLTQGTHHVDVTSNYALFDAVLLTSDPSFLPALDCSNLPSRVNPPTVRQSRNYYRNDSGLSGLAGSRGYVVASLPALYGDPYDMPLNDYVPTAGQVISQVNLWGSIGQYISGTVAVRALTAGEFTATLSPLAGPNGTVIPMSELDVKVVGLLNRPLGWPMTGASAHGLLPELLLYDDRTGIPPTGAQGGYGGGTCVCGPAAHESRQFWITVHIPPTAPDGTYSGTLTFAAAGDSSRTLTLPVTVTVRPVLLQPVQGNYGIFQTYTSATLGASQYVEILHDMIRHGLNSTTLYGGYADLQYMHQAGMTGGYACQMSWPDGSCQSQIAQAKAWGLLDYLYYDVDEPNTPSQITTAINEAIAAHAIGAKMYTAISTPDSWPQLRDYIDQPVLALTNFWGPDNAAPVYAKSKGFLPSSYWMTHITDLLYYRAFVGLYNTRCGYQGCAPWAHSYSHDPATAYTDNNTYCVIYPDATGLPISTIRWEAYKDGIDDVRYLQAMDRAIAAAQVRQGQPNPPAGLAAAISNAQTVRHNEFETIGSAYPSYYDYLNTLAVNQLDTSRSNIADAIVQLNSLVGTGSLTGAVALSGYQGDNDTHGPVPIAVRIKLQGNGSTFAQVQLLDANNRFTLDSVTPGIYSVAIKAYAHRQAVIPNVYISATGAMTDLGTVILPGGNNDGDNEVTSTDLSIVLAHLGQMGNP